MYVSAVMSVYAENFNKGLCGVDINITERSNTTVITATKTRKQKKISAKRGEVKEGNHMHAQLIVSRKTADNGRLISPMNNHRGSNAGHSQKFGQFDRMDFTERCVKAFDRTFIYERELTETFKYRKAMVSGSVHERADMIVVERNLQTKPVKEQQQVIAQTIREKKEISQESEIKPKQEQKQSFRPGR